MKKILVLLITALLVVALAACSASQTAPAAQSGQVQTSSTAAATAVVTPAASVADAMAENSGTHDDEDDYEWESSAVIPITLNGDSIAAGGDGVAVDGSKATITSAGTYSLSGSLADGQIVVDTDDDGVVRLVLSGVDIRNSTGAPIYVVDAKITMIVLADGTENYVTDGASYVFADPAEDEPNAAIFSKGDLTIYGNGALTVNGNYNDAIASKDGLIIASGTITANAADDGIRGKDYLVVKGGTITVNAQGDGLKSDNEEDATKGYISIEAGGLAIAAGADAIDAQTDVMIAGGDFTIVTGGGSRNRADDSASAKGIKAAANVNIDGGTFDIDSADDAVHSNGAITVNAGTFTIASADDGMHADAALEINGGDVRITESYEGLESAVITINAGDFAIVASDDGINVAGGNDASGMTPGMGPGAQPRRGGGPGQDAFTYSGNYHLYINGGYIVLDAGGDGLDANGVIEMSGGVVLVNGPTQQMNGALDHAGFTMTGGFLVAAGSSGMAQAPGTSSSQNSVLIYFSATQPAGTLVHIQNSAGEDVLTFAPAKQYQSLALSSAELVNGATYVVYTGGSSTGAAVDGLYQDGTYTPGAQNATFTVSGAVTTVGSGGRGPRP